MVLLVHGNSQHHGAPLIPGSTNFMLKKILLIILIITAAAHTIFFTVTSGFILYYKNHNPSRTTLMLYREIFCKQELKELSFTAIEQIPDDIIKMIIATEDYRFNEHPGIDIDAIKRAYFINRKAGYFMYGGSTITQQLARTLFLYPKKILVRKYLEIIIAFELEMFLPKERILELYVNYCEWGKGIYGITAASRHYYSRDMNRLTPDEVARLVAILANPLSCTPGDLGNKKFIINRYNTIKFRYYTYLKFNDLEREVQQ